jgi:hypothetical protein
MGSKAMSISKILEGIDRCEVDHADGWWETSSGATFGRKKLIEAQGYEFGLLSRIEALEKDVKRLDFISYHGLLCLDSASNKAGGNGQKQVAATRCNIDTAIEGEAK